MASNNNQLNQGELTLYSMLISQKVVPVGVDLAARVFQVCYLTEKQQLKNKSLSRDAFLDFLKSPPFSKPMLVGFEACGACNYFAKHHLLRPLSPDSKSRTLRNYFPSRIYTVTKSLSIHFRKEFQDGNDCKLRCRKRALHIDPDGQSHKSTSAFGQS